MFDSLKKNKILLIVFVAVALLFAWFTLSGGSNTAPSRVLTTASSSSRVAVDQDILRLLLDMRSISLDGSVFNTPAFVLLRDFGREIVPEPVGRENPFAPTNSAPTQSADSSLFDN